MINIRNKAILRIAGATTILSTLCAHGQNPADHSVRMNPSVNQIMLQTATGEVKHYNTDELSEVNIDNTNGTVSVIPKSGDWNDEYCQNVTSIGFSKTPESGECAEIVNGGVNITEAKGWLESAYIKWDIMDGASSYRIYIKGGKYADYTPTDRELSRNYGTYGRADIVGLTTGTYSIKVVPVVNGVEDDSSASEAKSMTVRSHNRKGFAHHNFSGVGAYDDNGELKDDARVIYVTAETAKTVQCEVLQSAKETAGKGTVFTGLQQIIKGYQKGFEKRPLAIRIIGTIKANDMDSFLSSSEGLQVKGKNGYAPMNITIEGIGEDAAIHGFGILVRNSSSIEMRNFGIYWFMDDGISLDTDNSHIWIHHLDIFYGQPGKDKDQIKGDGSVDVKGDSKYITFANIHFFDSGKMSLCGMKSETGPNYIDYNSNWFDHSDSRHPRIRTMTVHVWNNYYDGIAKYGVGVTSGGSAFVERNFFRATKHPMLISKQGTDAKGSGTFSNEPGGIIKSFGNVYADNETNGYMPVTQNMSITDFDCYEASTRDETIPETYTAKAGGSVYDNFDTNPTLIYDYSPLEATDVPAYVTGYFGAGRLNKGDFKWSFDNLSEDSNYNLIVPLQTAVKNYSSTLIGIFE
ncbi:MAG: pectate lyase [Duncaniella sp.]|nr:pectate lyase [Duncaniella sp.]